MPRLNGRIAQLEKQLPPTTRELFKVIDKTVSGTFLWGAAMRLKAGKGTADDKAMLDAFWTHETWQGTKLALDAVWPRRLWEPAYLSFIAQRWGYRDYVDCIAYQLWHMKIEPQVAAMSFYATEQEEPDELDKLERYGRFCQLPQDEQNEWREVVKEEIISLYNGGEHTLKVAQLINKIADEYNKLADNTDV